MNITMTETRRGSEDGHHLTQFLKGIVYFDVPHTLLDTVKAIVTGYDKSLENNG